MVSDFAIAIALLWQLSRIKSPFRATQRCVSYYLVLLVTGIDLILNTYMLCSLVRRLMASTISTGTVTSVVITVASIGYLINKWSAGKQYLKLFKND